MTDATEANAAPSAKGVTLDPAEVDKFARDAEHWWAEDGPFAPLHRINPIRIGFLRDVIASHYGRAPTDNAPLEGLRVLDAGCGGGLVAEPLARLGARVTALDASEDTLRTAKAHSLAQGLDIDYRNALVEQLLEAGEAPFDAVLSLEVVEHVAEPEVYLQTCARLVKPGGVFVLSTLNKTLKSLALGVAAAEYVLGWVPKGTHDWRRFLAPGAAARTLRSAGLTPDKPVGMSFSPVSGWRLSLDTSINYFLTASRPEAARA